MDTIAESSAAGTEMLAAPQPIFNCRECRHWLPEGTLACPECHAIVYAEHLRDLALRAREEESSKNWEAARETWRATLGWLPPETSQRDVVANQIKLIDSKLAAAQDTKARWTKRLGPLAPIVFFLMKAKSALFLLFKLKFLLSFLGFFAIYWALFGWKFGLGFTLSILIHEMGHYVAARRQGLKVDMPIFLPGLGAYVRWYSMGIALDDLATIALAGPFFGLLVALLCAGLSLVLHSPLFSALANVTALLNVFNLTPVFGLDGAQATYALDRTQRWLVLATALIFFGMLHEWLFLIVAVGMGWRIWRGGYADQPSTKTMLRFVLLLFTLGIVLYRFTDPTGRF